MKKFLIILVLLLAAFAAGYVPGYLKLQDAERRSEEVRESLEAQLEAARTRASLLALQGELGKAMIEAQQKNFGKAREHSTRFFEGLSRAANDSSNASLKAKLASISDHRDEVTSELASLSPDAIARLQKLYFELSQATDAL